MFKENPDCIQRKSGVFLKKIRSLFKEHLGVVERKPGVCSSTMRLQNQVLLRFSLNLEITKEWNSCNFEPKARQEKIRLLGLLKVITWENTQFPDNLIGPAVGNRCMTSKITQIRFLTTCLLFSGRCTTGESDSEEDEDDDHRSNKIHPF